MNDVPRSPYTGVQGWESIHEQGVLIALAMTVPNHGQIVEIGSEYGMSASIWLKYAKMGVSIFCIEINPDAPFLDNLEDAGLKDNLANPVKWINEDSRFVDLKAQGLSDIDLLFVDGDHNFEGALDDLMHYTPAVSKGGLMAIHDCASATNRNPHPLHYAVSSAVHHWLASPEGKNWKHLFSVDSTMVFRKSLE